MNLYSKTNKGKCFGLAAGTLLFTCLFIGVGCAGPANRRFITPSPTALDPPMPRTFISPAGQPFRAQSGGDAPMKVWFDQADSDQSGSLSFDEFFADHRRFFEIVDTDRSGDIGGAEVNHYETVLAPEILSAADRGEGRRPGGGPGMGGPRGGRGGGRGGPLGSDPMEFISREGAARFSLINEPEPIRAADQNFDFKVTREEWRAAAQRRFKLLDPNQSSGLQLAALELMRPGSDRAGGGRPPRGRGGGRRLTPPHPDVASFSPTPF